MYAFEKKLPDCKSTPYILIKKRCQQWKFGKHCLTHAILKITAAQIIEEPWQWKWQWQYTRTVFIAKNLCDTIQDYNPYFEFSQFFTAYISWWRHQMETSSALLAICAGNSPVPGEFTTQRPVTRSFDVFFNQCLFNGWVNNGEAGDLRRYRAHYDVTVMFWKYPGGHYLSQRPTQELKISLFKHADSITTVVSK